MKIENKIKSKIEIILVPAFVLFAAIMTSSCGSSPSSTTEIEDPTNIKALFTISSTYKEEGTRDREKVIAGATFFEGIQTVEFLKGEIDLVDPDGNVYPLALKYNIFGAPYYEIELGEDLELGAFYTFQVLLANGRLITNSIRIPDERLQITNPTMNQIIDKEVDLDVSWTGSSDRDILIIISPDDPDLLQLGGNSTSDDGLTTLYPEHLHLLDQGPTNFTMVRGSDENVNGFHTKSKIMAFLLYTRPVEIQ